MLAHCVAGEGHRRPSFPALHSHNGPPLPCIFTVAKLPVRKNYAHANTRSAMLTVMLTNHLHRCATFRLVCFQRAAAPGAIRVGCIGDSITAVGHTSSVAHHYPDQLQDILDAKHGNGTYSVTNLGVCKYRQLYVNVCMLIIAYVHGLPFNTLPLLSPH